LHNPFFNQVLRVRNAMGVQISEEQHILKGLDVQQS